MACHVMNGLDEVALKQGSSLFANQSSIRVFLPGINLLYIRKVGQDWLFGAHRKLDCLEEINAI